ncbi:Dihydropteroate synthase [Myxococcus hansupus]|uniref:Dihydropteroate synthase n=1 Tax=Pseudomyxococcus hansupus TaxID=1297742 RepID=A0A0H4WVK7_9BACT|nr:dihydropteroate synthase [Myxococcus hansupus]AKQ65638.1 Dihydropteroate synthase [Myxococcus hansupus]
MATARAEGRGLTALASAVESALASGATPPALSLGDRRFEWGARTYVMGVVNVTPDSFSDGGRFASTEAAIAHGLALAEAGADLLDVGGESTRPGSLPVSVEDELARVVPVIEGLRARTAVPLSVDTTKAAVAREALRAGAHLINDVTGFGADAELPRVVSEAGAACCLMHIQGTPATMQQAPRYDDLVEDVLAFLEDAIARAEAAGIPRGRILLDPGIGFGKTFEHNLFLLRRLNELRVLGLPLLVGTSRKGFLGRLAGGKPASERLAATLGSVASMAALGGADVVRVHDVAEARDALAVADAIRRGEDGGALYAR